MRTMMLALAAPLLGGGAYVTGFFDSGEYHALAPDEVEARLAKITFGPELFLHPGIDAKISMKLQSRSPQQVRWDLAIGDKKAGEVNANLAARGTGTQVAVDVAFVDHDAMAGLHSDPFMQEFAQAMMAEKVTSTLEDRPFSDEAVASQLAGFLSANPAAIANWQARMIEQVEQDMIEMGGAPARAAPAFPKARTNGGWSKSAK